MKGRPPLLLLALRRLARWLRRTQARLQGPPSVLLYQGFGNAQRIFLCGRVIQDKGIRTHTDDSTRTNILNTLKRFASVGVADARLLAEPRGQSFELQTDEEGFFQLDGQIPTKVHPASPTLEQVRLLFKGTPPHPDQSLQADVYVPARNAPYGIITDIDDTILHTRVRSWFKWRAVYLTLFFNAFTRQHIQGAPGFLQQLHQQLRPVFYVSNSPWNLYDMMLDFLHGQQFPDGPVLLRDLRTRNLVNPIEESHKYQCIVHILHMYQNLPFILLGDSSERDPELYTLLARQFPNQVCAIFIRIIGKVMHPVSATSVPICYFHDYQEAEAQAKAWGLF
jgi:phosphatidate phosphatase APP1